MDNPDGLAEYMLGFMDGTILNTFDLKPIKEWVVDEVTK